MAKIKFGMMMTDARGKLGGQVFSKNRGGSYVRTKVTPSNPQTPAQMAVRGAFASISSTWSALTEAGRESFNSLVSAYSTTDIFGDLRNPSGKALFQRLNQNLVNAGASQLAVCPEPSEVPFANLSIALVDLSTTTFTIESDGNTTGSKILVFATPSMSQGTKFVKNKMRQIKAQSGADGVALEVWSAYTNKFGVPVVGANVYVGLKVVNANGQASPMETIKVVVSA